MTTLKNNTWITQTALGYRFGMSSVMMGRELEKLGYREHKMPSVKALDEDLATLNSVEVDNKTRNTVRWNGPRMSRILIDAGYKLLSDAELKAYDDDLAGQRLARRFYSPNNTLNKEAFLESLRLTCSPQVLAATAAHIDEQAIHRRTYHE